MERLSVPVSSVGRAPVYRSGDDGKVVLLSNFGNRPYSRSTDKRVYGCVQFLVQTAMYTVRACSHLQVTLTELSTSDAMDIHQTITYNPVNFPQDNGVQKTLSVGDQRVTRQV